MIRMAARAFGRVQGVGFRRKARDEAEDLGLVGWVRNETDGSVAVEYQGERSAVDAMTSWLARGPFFARVDRLDVREISPVDGEEAFIVSR